MAKADRTTPAAPAAPALASDEAGRTESGWLENEGPAEETPVAAAEPLRTTLADGTEYVVRPPKPAPVVGMSRRRRESIQRTRLAGRGRADGVIHGTPDAARPLPIDTEGAGPASVNSSEA